MNIAILLDDLIRGFDSSCLVYNVFESAAGFMEIIRGRGHNVNYN